MSMIAAVLDPAADGWAICDEVVQLRQRGTNHVYVLPGPHTAACLVGSADLCSLRLFDPAGLVSRQHACLIRQGARWIARDLDSQNGLWIDGVRCREFALAPGVEIGLGGITLIAESAKLVALRGFLARLLGWGEGRTRAIDHAVRSVRLAASHRATLVLCGAGELVTVAQALHRHARGADRPFIVCDPRRRRPHEHARSAQTFEKALRALRAAAGGSLCVSSQRPPRDFADAALALQDPRTRVQLVVCSQELPEPPDPVAPGDSEAFLALPISVPSLADRAGELDRIISEYAEEATAELGVPPASFTFADHGWVRKHSSSSLPEIERGTRHLVAIRTYRTVARAAEQLRMAPVSLSRWIGRRQLPVHVEELSRVNRWASWVR
jgi:hypothetical protein